MKKLLFPLLVTLALVACQKKLQVQSGMTGIDVERISQDEDLVQFRIQNNTVYTLNIESTFHLFIEQKSDQDQWVRVGYVPCACGTPCMDARPTLLEPGGEKVVEWNLLTRGCKTDQYGQVETIERKVDPGYYRLRFTVNPERNGIRINPESLAIVFKVN